MPPSNFDAAEIASEAPPVMTKGAVPVTLRTDCAERIVIRGRTVPRSFRTSSAALGTRTLVWLSRQLVATSQNPAASLVQEMVG
jgi:hypothetical protein